MFFRIGQIYRYYYVVCGTKNELRTFTSLYVFRTLSPGAKLDRDWNFHYEFFPLSHIRCYCGFFPEITAIIFSYTCHSSIVGVSWGFPNVRVIGRICYEIFM